MAERQINRQQAERLSSSAKNLIKYGHWLLEHLPQREAVARARVGNSIRILEDFVKAVEEAVKTDDLESFQKIQQELVKQFEAPIRIQ